MSLGSTPEGRRDSAYSVLGEGPHFAAAHDLGSSSQDHFSRACEERGLGFLGEDLLSYQTIDGQILWGQGREKNPENICSTKNMAFSHGHSYQGYFVC